MFIKKKIESSGNSFFKGLEDNDSLIKKYFYLFPKYNRLGENVKEVLENKLNSEDISYVYVDARVKKLNQFIKKIERKKYKEPFSQTEDLCGIRIICFFQNDVEKIGEIIKKEFKVLSTSDKQKEVESTAFGYRSKHYIIKIKKNWCKIPNYEGMDDLKVEIQVRTILMHAWAEIEHKLAYKKETHIPPQFRRRFSLLSAKLEEADEQFEALSMMIYNNKYKIIEDAQKYKHFDKKQPLSLDSLQAFLDYHFPHHMKNISQTRDLLDEILNQNVSISDLVEYLDKKEIKKTTKKEKQRMGGQSDEVRETLLS